MQGWGNCRGGAMQGWGNAGVGQCRGGKIEAYPVHGATPGRDTRTLTIFSRPLSVVESEATDVSTVLMHRGRVGGPLASLCPPELPHRPHTQHDRRSRGGGEDPLSYLTHLRRPTPLGLAPRP